MIGLIDRCQKNFRGGFAGFSGGGILGLPDRQR
jgi:hypothetical protein